MRCVTLALVQKLRKYQGHIGKFVKAHFGARVHSKGDSLFQVWGRGTHISDTCQQDAAGAGLGFTLLRTVLKQILDIDFFFL